MGTVVITFPVSAFTMAIILLSQPENRRRFLASIAKPLGDAQGASGQTDFTFSDRGSMTVISLLTSMLTKTSSASVLTLNSGLPLNGTLLMILPVAAAIAV